MVFAALSLRLQHAAAVLLAAVALALTGCAETQLLSHAGKQSGWTLEPSEPSRPKGVYKVGNPYQVAGVWYYPKEDPYYDQTGIASWYGEPFHGRLTANGERYDMNELTAAHQTLPMPSLVRVTNLENGRSIIVRLNDRGPFVNGRIIDLSRRSAQLLGMERQGTAKVRVQMVGPTSGDPMVAQPRPPAPAEEQPQVAAAPRDGVVAEALPPPPGAEAQPAPNQTAMLTPAAPATPSAASLLAAQPEAGPDLEHQPVRIEPVRATAIYIQAGAFTLYDNAHRLSARLSVFGKANVSSTMVNGSEFFRVRLGPMESVAEADAMLAQMIGQGHEQSRIVVE